MCLARGKSRAREDQEHIFFTSPKDKNYALFTNTLHQIHAHYTDNIHITLITLLLP